MIRLVVGAAALMLQPAPIAAQPSSQVWLGPGETALLGVADVGLRPCTPAKERSAEAWDIGPCEFRELLKTALDAEVPKPTLGLRDAAIPIDAPHSLYLTTRTLDLGSATSVVPFLVRLSLYKSGKVYSARVPGVSVVVLWTHDRFQSAPRSDLGRAVRDAAQDLLREFAHDLEIARVVEK